MSDYTEDHLVEQPAIHLMQHELGWDVVNCYDEWTGCSKPSAECCSNMCWRNIRIREPQSIQRPDEGLETVMEVTLEPHDTRSRFSTLSIQRAASRDDHAMGG
jgi:hypothetical protein